MHKSNFLTDLAGNWQALDEKKKRRYLIGGVVGGGFALLILSGVVMELIEPSRKPPEPEVIKSKMSETKYSDRPGTHFLDSVVKNNADYEREALKGQLADLRTESDIQQRKFDERLDGIDGRIDGLGHKINNFGNSIDELALSIARERSARKAQASFLANQVTSSVAPATGSRPVESSVLIESAPGGHVSRDGVMRVSPFDMMTISQVSGLNVSSVGYTAPVSTVAASVAVSQPTSTAADSTQLGSNQISADDQQQAQDTYQSASSIQQGSSQAKPIKVTRIPAGSLIKANLVSGLDAPISQTAKDNPHPVLAKVVGQVLMPNGKRMDLSGCVFLSSGYGELSTERVYLQSKTLSCISKNNEIIETTFKSSAIGPDGKVGIRGTVVTKDEDLIMKNMQAGALQGLALAFSGGAQDFQVQTDQPYALPDAEYMQRTMIGKGVQNSLDAMIKRYNRILDQIAPVIEINAGRHVEFQVLQGFDIQVISK